jgi:hypothetical protein
MLDLLLQLHHHLIASACLHPLSISPFETYNGSRQRPIRKTAISNQRLQYKQLQEQTASQAKE